MFRLRQYIVVRKLTVVIIDNDLDLDNDGSRVENGGKTESAVVEGVAGVKLKPVGNVDISDVHDNDDTKLEKVGKGFEFFSSADLQLLQLPSFRVLAPIKVDCHLYQ